MTPNVGTTDRILRATLGVVLLLAPFVLGLPLFESTVATTVSVIVGLVMLGTAAFRLCPLYSLFGFNTCRIS